MTVRSDLAHMAQHASARSERFGFAAMTLFLISVIMLGFTDPRAKNSGRDRLRDYLRGFVFTTLGTLGFLVIEGGVFVLLIRNIHLQ
jgi:glucose uptake protein GlcU